MYPSLKDSLWGGKVFTFAGTSGNVSIHPVELLATMAENQDTNLFRWLASRDLQVQDLDFEQARLAWVLLYGNAGGQARFTSDAQQRGRVEWRMIGQVADAIAPDTRLTQGPNTGPHVTETPPGLSMVRRVNSGDLGVKEVAAQNQGVPRSFVRTWVRILSKNSNELKLKGFVVK
jgi:hypothetical protein